MYFEDYIIRQIAQATAVIAKVLDLSKSGKNEEACVTIDQAIEELVGLNASIVKQIDDLGLISLLMSGPSVDYGKVYVLAELFKLEGDVLTGQGRNEESWKSYQRALMLYSEYVSQCSDEHVEEVLGKIEELEKYGLSGRKE